MTNREAIEYASKHSFLELYELGKAAGAQELTDWLVKYKVIPDGAMQELIRDFKGEMGKEQK